jgi:DNA-binding GntR family transcriptional regulator
MVKPYRYTASTSTGSGARAGRSEILADLPALRPLPTAAERAAEVIRDNIFEGRFAPGTALPEAALSKALQVSRNTVREAFRALTSEHLLTYEAHKGVMVRSLSVDDVGDIYRLRRMFELAAVDHAIAGTRELNVGAIGDLVTTAEQLAAAGRWNEVGTVNLRFHEEIVAGHQSPRINEIFRRLMTEIRLGFLVFADQAELHGAFVPRNRELHGLMAGGDLKKARAELARYLDEAEQRITIAIHGNSD